MLHVDAVELGGGASEDRVVSSAVAAKVAGMTNPIDPTPVSSLRTLRVRFGSAGIA
jgi:uncharacterized membrane protein